MNGSKVTVILLKGWILPIGGASAVEGLRSTRLPRLVFLRPGFFSKDQIKGDILYILVRYKLIWTNGLSKKIISIKLHFSLL